MDETKISVLFGYITLMPYRWVTDGFGRSGQQYLRIEHDRNGREVSSTVLEPVVWLIWE